MRIAAMMLVLLAVGGCVGDDLSAADKNAKLGSTSSRRFKDKDEPEKMCQDTSIAGESKTVCY